MPGDTTTIAVSNELRDKLEEEFPGDNFTERINFLLDEADADELVTREEAREIAREEIEKERIR